jgi:hypothetical protein
LNLLQRTWQPALYHGRGQGKGKTFFEGWYFKLIAPHGSARYAIIPGIYLHGHDESLSHAFVQTLDGLSGQSVYHRYPVNEFRAAEDAFDLWVGPNHFNLDQITLDIDQPEQVLTGRLQFEGVEPWPVSRFSPGVMGWYAFVPFMQCYHGVLGFDHRLDGRLRIDGRDVDFSGGRGYIEKDWGQGFPKAYVWMQSNHFATPGTSLTGSIATIPWLNTWFRGFIVGLRHEGSLYRFTTYVGAKVASLRVTHSHVEWVLNGGRKSGPKDGRFDSYHLEIVADRAEGAALAAPEPVGMIERVVESLTATVDVRLTATERGRRVVLFEERGDCAALEVSGAIEDIID